MRILLIGEYSGVFTELSTALKNKGYDVFTISNGDGYKKFPADILFKYSLKQKRNLFDKLLNALRTYLGIMGLFDFFIKWRKYKPYFGNYDIVQLINPIALTGYGSIANYIMIRYVCKHNKKVFLSVLGDDFYTVDYLRMIISPSNHYFNTLKLREVFAVKYIWGFLYRKQNDYVVKHCKGIMASAYGYLQSYLFTEKCIKVLFPFPINQKYIGRPFTLKEGEPIIIFHGWQKGKEKRKGNDIFDRVIRKVVTKYGSIVDYRIVSGVTYEEYIKTYESAHIFIDQLYAEDKGYNALLGMAAGKVVFSGYNNQVLNTYPNYDGKIVGMDVTTDESTLFDRFCLLIDNPSLMEEISRNAIDFVIKNHVSSFVTDMFIKSWRDL